MLPFVVFRDLRSKVTVSPQIKSSGSGDFCKVTKANCIISESFENLRRLIPKKENLVQKLLTEHILLAKFVEANLLFAAELYLGDKLFKGILHFLLLFLL